MNPSEFDKRFPKQKCSTESDQNTVDFWRMKQQEGWVAALQCIQNLPRSTRYNYIELMVWIAAQLKAVEK